MRKGEPGGGNAFLNVDRLMMINGVNGKQEASHPEGLCYLLIRTVEIYCYY